MRTLTSIFFLFLINSLAAQQTTLTWEFDGVARKYIQYVPAVYDGSEAVPVVFCFHGLGDTMENFFGVGMDEVADTANFIAIFPQALIDPQTGSTSWNSGAGFLGFYPNQNIDDVGFVMAMLDTLNSQYNIDLNRVYATGFSMGGFFANKLACEHPEVFEAAASVAGTIGYGMVCEPAVPIRIAHFHGTADGTVDYINNLFGLSVAAWQSLWHDKNGCTGEAEGGSFPDLYNDGYTVDYQRYSNCEGNAEVVLYTINGADHVWLTSANDISYSTEIWRFFMGIYPSFSTTGLTEDVYPTASVYPNPSTDIVRIDLPQIIAGHAYTANLSDINGKSISVDLEWDESSALLNVSHLNPGIYVLHISQGELDYIARIMVQ